MNTEERLRRLHQALDLTRDKLLAQEKDLDRLRAEIASVALPRQARPASDIQVLYPARPRWGSARVYAALFILGLTLTMGVPWKRAAARPSLKLPQIAALEAPLMDPQSLADERSNDEVLGLVYGYTAPGERHSVQELLGPEIASSAGASPWVFVNVDARTTLASFRPYGDALETAPVYEFVVDRLARAVSASPDTILNLRTGSFLTQRRR